MFCTYLFVGTSNVRFGNRCPMTKDSPDFIDNWETVLDFSLEANLFDISSSSVDSMLDQTEAHYTLQTTNDSIRSRPRLCSRLTSSLLKILCGLKRAPRSSINFFFSRKSTPQLPTPSLMRIRCISLTRWNMLTRPAMLMVCLDLMLVGAGCIRQRNELSYCTQRLFRSGSACRRGRSEFPRHHYDI